MKFIKILLATALAFASAFAMAAVDINKATQAELESVKGIGPSMSAKMLDARKTGAFKDWSDLVSRVKGIGDGNARKFSGDGLTVNGVAYTGGPAIADKATTKSESKGKTKAAADGASAAMSKPAKPTKASDPSKG